MFRPGDKVYVEKSAEIDVGYTSYVYIMAHPYAQIRARFEPPIGTRETEVLYALEWPEEFPGGWDVYKTCLPGRGQQITSKHLSLDFEGSREVTTVPKFAFSQCHDPNDFGKLLDETGTAEIKPSR